MDEYVASVVVSCVTGLFGFLGILVANIMARSKSTKPLESEEFHETENSTYAFFKQITKELRQTRLDVLDETRGGFDRLETLLLSYDRARRQQESSGLALRERGEDF